MTKNVGSTDRIIRFIAGIFLLIMPFASGMAAFDSTLLTVVSVVVGLVLIGTAFVRFCPLYRLLGIRTCSI